MANQIVLYVRLHCDSDVSPCQSRPLMPRYMSQGTSSHNASLLCVCVCVFGLRFISLFACDSSHPVELTARGVNKLCGLNTQKYIQRHTKSSFFNTRPLSLAKTQRCTNTHKKAKLDAHSIQNGHWLHCCEYNENVCE